MAFLRFLLECCVRDDAQMSFFRGQIPVGELLRVSLDPLEKLVQFPHMLHFGVVVSPLECHNEHHHIYPCVGRIRDRTQQGDEEAA